MQWYYIPLILLIWLLAIWLGSSPDSYREDGIVTASQATGKDLGSGGKLNTI